jgi:hypothetical protein
MKYLATTYPLIMGIISSIELLVDPYLIAERGIVKELGRKVTLNITDSRPSKSAHQLFNHSHDFKNSSLVKSTLPSLVTDSY